MLLAQPGGKTMASEGPLVEEVRTKVFEVPTDQPEADGTLQWRFTTVVVAEVRAGGEIGTGWTYSGPGAQAVIDEKLAAEVAGKPVLDLPALWQAMARSCRNLGRPGLVSCAISAVDTALWDLKARLVGLPLSLLFGRCRREVPLYGSGGFTSYDDATTVAQLEQWVTEWGMDKVKLKVGESWGTRPGRDLERVALARKVIGDGAELFVDANGGYGRKQALRMGKRFTEEHGVSWFEEPVSSDDLAGLREVKEQCEADVAAGEYGYDPSYFAKMIDAGAVDCIQVDVTRCCGYTGFVQVAALAAAHNLDVSAHCAPNLHSHVAASLGNLRHVEYFHDHHRVENLLFEGTLSPDGGVLRPRCDSLGHGMALRPGSDEYRRG
ncbi:MAG TPA: enolase C-terminal domain-like protein [Acidimicrobiales bacterium]|nr:enolase C-terminal domain-like protein [Acidimicrobiales bacterium]